MELMTVMVIISILSVLSFQGFAYFMERARRVNCTSNLTGIYSAATSYITDNQSWPQISTANVQDPAYAQAWIDAFSKYNIQRINWLCPSVQTLLKNPDFTQPANTRIDYLATPFDSNITSPSKYPTQPWFIERADIHGDGNLMIFSSGQVKSLTEVLRNSEVQPLPQ